MKTYDWDQVMAAAREFGDALTNCDECRELERAREAMERDGVALRLVHEFQAKQRSIQWARMNGGVPTSEELSELEKYEKKLNSNGTIRGFVEAQKRVIEMLNNLNSTISEVIGIDFAQNSSAGECC